jgi:catechol 2,3-dioxygenase-like lactoylglutathione lyase family enzyme
VERWGERGSREILDTIDDFSEVSTYTSIFRRGSPGAPIMTVLTADKPAPSLAGQRAVLHGVHHTARPTWKLRETIEFYRDILGLPLVHTISARGWGPEGHPDFLHFFFDSGNGSTIAFFYYIGTEQPERLAPFEAEIWFYRASHTAWRVESEAELLEWKATLESRGLAVRRTRHEIIDSLYVNDPNGYTVEITWQVRGMAEGDAVDATMTLEAAMQLEDEARRTGVKLTDIERVWRRKAELVETYLAGGR